MFDCLDQQLFILARGAAMKSLLPPDMDANAYGTYATAIFVAGWATGGLIFGSVGDRIGRAKTLTITVLMYSVFTGLSALSKGWVDFAVYRFLTGLGVGGVFGLAVALTADALPDSARAGALGTLQALSAVGNVTAGLISMWVGGMVSRGEISADWSWKLMFIVGAAPAFLCVFIQMRLKEPEKWVKAREAGRISGAKFGSYASLFGDKRWRGPALFGMMLSVAGVIGLWGIGFFSPELVGPVIEESLKAQNLPASEIAGAKAHYIGLNSIVQNVGAFIGMLLMTKLAQVIGRKKAFAVAFVAALLATVGFFQFFNGPGDIWMSAVMGGCQLAIFAGFAIYLPELFPTRLRSTGTSFCYNVGRFVAALGILQTASIKTWASTGAVTATEKIDSFRDAASYMSVIFLIGLVALMFLPETKGRPMPED
ncbi:MFS transporter [Phragmitibacter flavus]|uniref:MFS transporter n=1 Tax=Phragmitibacter flavus TaxID=2576071 RepID=A0A5R8KC99_9BACT|nr:MFS transporter [Phragmitibacter flavus]TLD69921.1 MFS transporter [Phragmitibacter flavus]